MTSLAQPPQPPSKGDLWWRPVEPDSPLGNVWIYSGDGWREYTKQPLLLEDAELALCLRCSEIAGLTPQETEAQVGMLKEMQEARRGDENDS
jgi:hypothetical protein